MENSEKNKNNIPDTQKIVVHLDNQLLSTIWDYAVDAMIMVNEHGIIELFNPAAELLFGYSFYEMDCPHCIHHSSLSSPSWDVSNTNFMARGVRGANEIQLFLK